MWSHPPGLEAPEAQGGLERRAIDGEVLTRQRRRQSVQARGSAWRHNLDAGMPSTSACLRDRSPARAKHARSRDPPHHGGDHGIRSARPKHKAPGRDGAARLHDAGPRVSGPGAISAARPFPTLRPRVSVAARNTATPVPLCAMSKHERRRRRPPARERAGPSEAQISGEDLQRETRRHPFP